MLFAAYRNASLCLPLIAIDSFCNSGPTETLSLTLNQTELRISEFNSNQTDTDNSESNRSQTNRLTIFWIELEPN